MPPPEPYQVIDANGVSLTTGSFSSPAHRISIGPEQGGVSFSAHYESGVRNWRYSTFGALVKEQKPHSNLQWVSVTVMGASGTFLRTAAGPYVRFDGDGELSTSDVYTALDGSVATFNSRVDAVVPYNANAGAIATLTRPTGEVVTYHYSVKPGTSRIGRLQSVTNNHGYQIHLQYASNAADNDWQRLVKATALNNAVDPCAPTALSCTFTQSWPSLTFAQVSPAPNTVEQTVTDVLGRTTRYVLINGLLYHIRRPSQPNLDTLDISYTTYPALSQNVRVATVSNGAGAWSYWMEEPPTNDPYYYELTTRITDPLNNQTHVEVSSTDEEPATDYRIVRVASVTDPLNQKTAYGYSNAYRLQSVTRPAGDVSEYGYSDRGELSAIFNKAKPGSGLSDISLIATFSTGCPGNPALCNRPLTVTDARGGVTD
ncbi:RHS repeat domain-containing protein, partial [Brevundimonas sp. P7753]|uniref:RHS repeat domain-containing protein n=1 Tax=Brevundimonas sp. P7753 TaxID=2726982 RepID=UPI0015C04BFF